MKKIIVTLSVFITLWECKEKQKPTMQMSTDMTVNDSSFLKFKKYIAKNLNEIKHDSLLKVSLDSNKKLYLLSIISARQAGIWVLFSDKNRVINSNLKYNNINTQNERFSKIEELLEELKKEKNIDKNFCFECQADPTFFVLDLINSGKSQQTINLLSK